MTQSEGCICKEDQELTGVCEVVGMNHGLAFPYARYCPVEMRIMLTDSRTSPVSERVLTGSKGPVKACRYRV